MRRTAAWRLRLAGCHRRVRIHAGDFTARLPFEDATFDRVYGESVVGFQPADLVGSLLREVLRVLRPGGQFRDDRGVLGPGAGSGCGGRGVRVRDGRLRPRPGVSAGLDDP
ncbi:MAG: class I SAM-dependent methyltransferase [Gammaproteobacteria bacterium]|nr:class I SAM-dependent methyltransferase [Gammaproteobacteria bacterium]